MLTFGTSTQEVYKKEIYINDYIPLLTKVPNFIISHDLNLLQSLNQSCLLY